MWRFAERMSRVFGIALTNLAVIAALGGGATLAWAQTSALPVYRFFNTIAGGHFYTISEEEKNIVLQNYNFFRYEGVGFEANPVAQFYLLPVYRFFNTIAEGHFYTISEAEKTIVLQNFDFFRYEGVSFQASLVQLPGTLPVYRFFNTVAGGHFYTISEVEKNTVLQNYNWFRYEGVGFYAGGSGSLAPPVPIPVHTTLVELYGESTFVGYLIQPNESISERMKVALPDIDISNQALNSTTAADQLDGTDGVHPPWNIQMAQSKADIVIINRGINDANRNIPIDSFESTMGALVSATLTAGKKVILQTPNMTTACLFADTATRYPNCSFIDTNVPLIAEAVRRVAIKYNVPLSDAFAISKQMYMAGMDWSYDKLHPNAALAQLMTDDLVKLVKQVQ